MENLPDGETFLAAPSHVLIAAGFERIIGLSSHSFWFPCTLDMLSGQELEVHSFVSLCAQSVWAEGNHFSLAG